MSFVIDMREKNEVAEFSDSPAADIDLARTFWTSVQLQPPPMESRLVSSDIKQRLKVASSRSSKEGAACSENQDKTEKFLSKAKRLTELDQFKKYQWYMQVREEQLERLAKRRKERMQIEEKAGQENDAEIFLKMKLKFEENVRKAEERARETWAMRAEIRSFEEKKNLDSDDNSEGK